MPTPEDYIEEDEKLRRFAKEDEFAKDVLEEARVQLMLKFRFLDLALWRMDLIAKRDALRMPLGTTGKRVYYDTYRIISRYIDSFDEIVRDYLHSVMHCVFRHPYDEGYPHTEAWDLACDVIVESVIIDMLGGRFPSDDDRARLSAISEMKMLVGMLVPAKLYTLLRDAMNAPEGTRYRGLDSSKLAQWRVLFDRDSHECWPSRADDSESDDDGDVDSDSDGNNDNNGDEIPDEGHMETGDDSGDESDNQQQQQQQQQTNTDNDTDKPEDEQGPAAQGGSDVSPNAESDDEQGTNPQDLEQEPNTPEPAQESDSNDDKGQDELEQEEKDWEEVAKQIEMNLEMFAKGWGEEASNLVSSLSVANRKKYSYTDFLRSFMVMNEAMKLDMDEFDYIYYTYGMDTYGNMPLIEPLEYKDTKQIRDFVIAVDTSESTRATLVQRFIEHTFEILKESENFAREVNIHIIQCDSKVQSDTKITQLKQVDELMEDFHIRGFGGTDFRPVFDYVEALRERGDLREMKGLIYFTDGLGRFPEKTPDYETAFVFMNDGDAPLPPIPPWAIKIVMDEHAINRMKTSRTIKKRKKRLLAGDEEDIEQE